MNQPALPFFFLPTQGLSQLRSLEALSVDSNDMEYLPDWLGGLGCLTSLVVSRNKLRSLPTALGTCSSLVRLEASYNKVRPVRAC